MYQFFRPALFLLPSELAHTLALQALSVLGLCSARTPIVQPRELMGLTFANPVGLAAGFDKNAKCVDGLAMLGFGFIEVGTVTPKAQRGNSKPRLFRAPEHRALVNRLGFNNLGIEAMISALKKRRYQGVLGISIGKNTDTTNQAAVHEYLHALDCLYVHADYIALNLSSPNTPGLRQSSTGAALTELLRTLIAKRNQLADAQDKYVPIVIKLSPDLSTAELDAMTSRMVAAGIDGLIATNTTVDRPAALARRFGQDSGGLSGAPLHARSVAVIQQIRRFVGRDLVIIGSGGIMTEQDMHETLAAGADLVQLYTGLIYQGPALVSRLLSSLRTVQE